MTKMLEAALEYVKAGFKVLPVNLDKEPLTKHGLKDATMTQQGVREYWGKFPNAGIGLVTDGFIVLDFDYKHNGLVSRVEIEEKYGLPQTRIHLTGGGGFHYLYRNPNGIKIGNTVRLGGYSGVDLRADGGYIVAPPSPHSSGNNYQIYDCSPIIPAPDWLTTMATSKDSKPLLENDTTGEGTPKENWITELMQGVPEGQRDASCIRLAGYYLTKMPPDVVREVLYTFANRCTPPFPHNDVDKCVDSVLREERTKRNDSLYGVFNTPILNTLTDTKNSNETFQNRDKTVTNSHQGDGSKERPNYSASFDNVLKEAGKMSRRDIALSIGLQHTSDTFRQIIKRRLDDTQIRQYRGSPDVLEWVNKDYKVLSLADYRKQAHLSITLPLNLNKYVYTPGGSVIGIAGFTSSAKTSMLLEICELNVNTQPLPVYYWFNEMSEDRILERLEDYPQLVTEMGNKFKAVKQTDFEFYDVLDPDGINVIDYLDMDGDKDEPMFMIGAVIKKLQRALGKGIVIFALQKRENADFGYGGVFSVKLSNLYLSLDIISQGEKSMVGKCKIVKAKDWGDINPVGLYCSYYTGGKHGKIMSDNLWRRETNG